MAVALAYFGYLACVAVVRQSVPMRRRVQAVALALTVILSILTAGGAHILPIVYILIGYWIPALLVTGPDLRLGEWLLACDHRLFGRQGLAAFAASAPRLLVGYLELAYLLCYAVIPAGWAWLVLSGYGEHGDRFWMTVLLASFGCYGLLPWLPSLAPRALEPPPGEPFLIKRLNVLVLDRASVQWNTFPSGHTAASLAVALALGIHQPAAGVVFGVIALSIAAGSVVGRYHYAADAIAGAIVAIAAFAIASVVHAP